MNRWIGFLIISGSILSVAGCDRKNSHPDEISTGADTREPNQDSDWPALLDTEVTTIVTADVCPNRREPMSPLGTLFTVGDGSPASCTDASLKAVVEQAKAVSGGATIMFDCGVEPHTIVLDGPIGLNNNQLLFDGEHRIALSGDHRSRVFETSGGQNHLMLQRIEIRDGQTEIYGGAIFSDWRGALTAIDVRFENNHATQMVGEKGGGAVRLEGPNDSIFSGCTFVGNSAINGGAVYTTAGNVDYIGCVFKSNTAKGVPPDPHDDGLAYGSGGAIRLDGMHSEHPEDLHICGCVFESNVSAGATGAVDSYVEPIGGVYPATYLEYTVFSDNTGPSVGAYLHMNGEMHMKSTTFIGSKGESNGAIFLATSQTSTIENCTFANNTAGAWASVRIRDGETLISGSTFVGNSSEYVNVLAEGDSQWVTLSNNVFLDNYTVFDSHPRVCRGTMENDGGGNIQWPGTRPDGQDDVPCTASVLFADPELGELTTSAQGIPFYPPSPGGKADQLNAGAVF